MQLFCRTGHVVHTMAFQSLGQGSNPSVADQFPHLATVYFLRPLFLKKMMHIVISLTKKANSWRIISVETDRDKCSSTANESLPTKFPERNEFTGRAREHQYVQGFLLFGPIKSMEDASIKFVKYC